MIFTKLNKWDNRWFERAQSYAGWSKDPSRKIGAVAIDPVRKVELSGGYNGFPRGILDSKERLTDRPTKYRYVVHAEQNVVYNAAYNGVSLMGAHLYVIGLPICSDCAKGVIQSGISHVKMLYDEDVPDIWKASGQITLEMFREAGIKVNVYK